MVVGSQARILYADAEGRIKIALAFNKAIADGKIGPIVLGRDHHDVSGTETPSRKTSNIYDGSKFTADMAIHNVIGDSFRGATWVSIHNGDAMVSTEGADIDAFYNTSGYPSATLNREGESISRNLWSSRTLQRPGMWFELDLHETRTISGLALDTAGSPNDYPHGYVVRLSTDGQGWEEVARRDQNDRPSRSASAPDLPATFASSRPAAPTATR